MYNEKIFQDPGTASLTAVNSLVRGPPCHKHFLDHTHSFYRTSLESRYKSDGEEPFQFPSIHNRFRCLKTPTLRISN